MRSTLAMCARIVFGATNRRGALELRRPSEVHTDTSIQQICQSATLTIPRNIRQFKDGNVRDLIRRNDPVQVYLGYNGDLQLEFDGYVESVSAGIPIEVALKDRLYPVLRRSFNKSYKNAYLPAVAKDIIGPDFKVEAMPVTLGPILFEQLTVAKALKKLKDDYGMVTYLKGDTVYCGIVYATQAPVVKYRIEVNVKKNDLEYRLADDVRLKVEAKSLLKDGKKLTVTVGDEDGELRTLPYYGISDKAALKKLAEADMQKFKYNGYKGGFTGFGIPVCAIGDKVALSSTQYPDRDGEYLAEAVKVHFTSSPYIEREITLAQRWI